MARKGTTILKRLSARANVQRQGLAIMRARVRLRVADQAEGVGVGRSAHIYMGANTSPPACRSVGLAARKYPCKSRWSL